MKIQNSQIFKFCYNNSKPQKAKQENNSATEIDTKISSEAVTNLGKAYLSLQSSPTFQGQKTIIPKEKLVELLAAGLTLAGMCEALGGIAIQTLKKNLQENGLEYTPKRNHGITERTSVEEFKKVHFDSTLSHEEKKKILGMSEITYYNYCKKHNIQTEQAKKQTRAKNITKEEFLSVALTDNTIEEKARQLGIGMNAYQALAAKYGVLTNYQKRQLELDKISREEFEAVFNLDIKKKEKCERLKVTISEFDKLADKFQLKSKLQLQREHSQNIDPEYFAEVYHMSIPEKAKWAMLGLSHVTYKKKAIELGLTKEFNSDVLNRFSESELRQIFESDMPLAKKMEILGCKNANTYYILLAQFGFQSRMQITRAKLASFTKEQVEEILYSDTPEKEKLAAAELTENNYKKLLHKFGLLQEWEKIHKYNKSVTKEQLQTAIIQSNTIGAVCKELNINYITFYKLVRKFGINYEALIPPTKKYGKRDYENDNYDELKNRLFYIYANEENKIAEHKDLLATLNFLFQQDNCLQYQKSFVIDFIKQLDKLEIKQTTTEEILNSDSYKEINRWISKFYEPYELQTKMELLSDTLSSEGLYHLQELCIKYAPQDDDLYNPKQIEVCKKILELTEKYIDKDNENLSAKDKKDLANILTYYNLLLSEPDNEILKHARALCTQLYNNNEPLHVQQIINAINLLKNNEVDKNLINDSQLFVNRINNTHMTFSKAIEIMVKLDNFFDTEESKNNFLNDFSNVFNSGTVIENRIIEEFIQQIYIKKDTVKTCQDAKIKREAVAILDKIGKEKFWNSKINIDKIAFLQDTEKYMDTYAESRTNRPGIKIFTLDNGTCIAEIKISGFNGARMFATPENIDDKILIFNDFAPRGFHTNRKK